MAESTSMTHESLEMQLEPDAIRRLLELYEELCYIAQPTSGRILTHNKHEQLYAVHSYWRNNDVRLKVSETRHSTALVHLPLAAQPPAKLVHVSCEPNADFDCAYHTYSGSDRYSVSVTKKPNAKTEADQDKQVITVFDHVRARKLFCKDMSSAKAHGKIICSADMGRPQMSYGEGHLLYTAAKYVDKKGYFDEDFGLMNSDEQQNAMTNMGNKFEYRQSWGEQLTECVNPELCVLDLNTGNVNVLHLQHSLPNVHATQAIWAPGDENVIFVGLDTSGEKLGRIFCFNRASAVYEYNLTSTACTQLSSGTNTAVTWPVFTPNGAHLLWAERVAGGTHGGCARLCKRDYETGVVETVVDIVEECAADVDVFAGLFVAGLPFANRCFAADNERMVISTDWRSNREIIVINIRTKTVTKLTNLGACHGSWTVLDVSDDCVLASCSSPTRPPCLLVARLPPNGTESSIVWLKIERQNVPVEDTTSALALTAKGSWHTLTHTRPATHSETDRYLDVSYESLLVQPGAEHTRAGCVPLVLLVHGGPHSVATSDWVNGNALLLSLGYALLIVNYRGSTGFGQQFVDCLAGNVGTTDVHDCYHATMDVLEKHKSLNGDRVFVMGGSHGGFLAGHLVAQYPNVFRGAVLRNPVLDMAAMSSLTDIRSWTLREGLNRAFVQGASLSESELCALRAKSPIAHAQHIRTPCMLHIGGADLRVPPHYHEWRQILQANNVPLKLLYFPQSNHSLSEVEVSTECVLNAVRFMEELL